DQLLACEVDGAAVGAAALACDAEDAVEGERLVVLELDVQVAAEREAAPGAVVVEREFSDAAAEPPAAQAGDGSWLPAALAHRQEPGCFGFLHGFADLLQAESACGVLCRAPGSLPEVAEWCEQAWGGAAVADLLAAEPAARCACDA